MHLVQHQFLILFLSYSVDKLAQGKPSPCLVRILYIIFIVENAFATE